MKVSKNIKLSELIEYGFKKILKKPNINDYNTDIEKEEFQYYNDCSDFDNQDEKLSFYEYVFEVGHARRGQFYYILIDDDRKIYIWASEPDGDGSAILMPDILVRLIKDEVII